MPELPIVGVRKGKSNFGPNGVKMKLGLHEKFVIMLVALILLWFVGKGLLIVLKPFF